MQSDQQGTPQTVTLMVNVRSRRGRQVVHQATQLLRDAGIHVVSVAVERPEQAEAVLKREVVRGAAYVIVGGGDGTLSHAAGLLRDTQTALAVLPLGTGNTFARSIGVPLDLREAIRLIAAGHRMQVDVGLVNDQVFLNSVGLGISAEIARTLTADVKRRFGLLAWPLKGFKAIWRHRALNLDVRTSAGEVHVHTHQLLVANGRYVAGPLRAAPDASVSDQQLDLLTFGDGGLMSLLWSGSLWATGHNIRRLQTTQLEIESRNGPVWVSMDGEVVQATKLTLSIANQALWVVVPKGFDARHS